MGLSGMGCANSVASDWTGLIRSRPMTPLSCPVLSSMPDFTATTHALMLQRSPQRPPSSGNSVVEAEKQARKGDLVPTRIHSNSISDSDLLRGREELGLHKTGPRAPQLHNIYRHIALETKQPTRPSINPCTATVSSILSSIIMQRRGGALDQEQLIQDLKKLVSEEGAYCTHGQGDGLCGPALSQGY